MIKNFFCSLFFLACLNVASQNNMFCNQINDLKTLVNTSHYAPKKVNDSLSKSVHKLFVNSLDKNRKFFTKQDIESFEANKYKIDDYINSKNCGFIDLYTNTLQERITQSKSILSKLLDEDLDYSGKDTLYFDSDLEFKYFKDQASATKYWKKRVRFKILTKLIEDDSIVDNIKANFKTLEANSKEKIIKNEICLLDELLNQNGGINKFVKESFLNAYLSYHDPNSIFFNNTDKNIFESSLANKQLTFGITTTKNDNGEIVISYITPGSPAFKNIDIEVNDIIRSIECNKVVLDTYCVSNEDITAFINDNNNKNALFKIKKSDNSIVNVKLTKKNIEVEDNSVRGYLISNHGKTTGYIKIPSFYTDFESPNRLGMANDVAKEIYKLKKEKIEGLIIDLRFNGGGSMKEASDLSGMFINRGPVSIIKYNNGETYTVKDSKRGKVFSEPIVVLVNYFSASASELFASVMQDYGRAIIVGTNTHGKSSAQVILPLNENEDLGFAKLTIEAFYRPTGKSHQSFGIIPDVALPSIYDDFKTQEQYYDFALKNDSILPTLEFNSKENPAIQKLKEASINRILENKEFQNIKTMNALLLKNYINKKIQYPLTLNNVYNDITSYKDIWKDFESTTNTVTDGYTVTNTTSTNEVIQYNDSEKEDNINALKELSEDIFLKEAHTILIDLININTTH